MYAVEHVHLWHLESWHLHRIVKLLSVACKPCIKWNFIRSQTWAVMNYIYLGRFLNQSHTSLWPAYDWFLEIAFVRNVSMCVCVSTPEVINN